MKTLKEVMNQEPIYMNDWNSKFEVIADFEDIYMSKEEYDDMDCADNKDYFSEYRIRMDKAMIDWKDINILFASYSCANYEGYAWVLFEKYGELYEVNGSHCSCYGLEGQFEPEETNLEVLEHRLLKGTFGEEDYTENTFKEKLCEFLGVEFIRNSR